MFDIGFAEMALIALIALLVLGPERLPLVARKLGLIMGKSRRMFNKFQQEFMRETNEIERQVQSQILAVKETVKETEEEFEKLITEEYKDEDFSDKSEEQVD